MRGVRPRVGCSQLLRRTRQTIMIQHFLQFVTAVLLVAIFWELCKINGQLKRSIPQISERGQADDADKSRAASPAC
jgi:hypothetical protein